LARRLLAALLVLAACRPADDLTGSWIAHSEAFVPRSGNLPPDSLLAKALQRPRSGDTLLLGADGACRRSLTGQMAHGRWSRHNDTLHIGYAAGGRDSWLVWRSHADTLVISPVASPSLVRVYVRTEY
jgi:hypothetical protein